jgi:4-hydroxybenzoate polyprenyltransferase
MNSTTIRSSNFWAYLQLMRPANIVTAWADILAGFAASGCFALMNQGIIFSLGWLLLSTTGLYAGGIVFNDVFDAELDAKERPERPIPSGNVSLIRATLLGSLLLSVGIAAAFQVSFVSGVLAFSIALAALLYDAVGKHQVFFGPLNMGICRGCNLLLGVSVNPEILKEYWFLALIPVIYIAAITTLSRGEVYGGKTSTGIIAVVMLCVVITALFGLGFLNNYQLLAALPFLLLFALRVLLPFVKAAITPTAENIFAAVRSGVISLIILDAAIAAGFAGFLYGILVLVLLGFSMSLARIFAVT